MSLTNDDIKMINRGLKPQFNIIHMELRSMRNEMGVMEQRMDKNFTVRLKLEILTLRAEIKDLGVYLKNFISRMFKETHELMNQAYATHEEVDTKIDDLRDELKHNVA